MTHLTLTPFTLAKNVAQRPLNTPLTRSHAMPFFGPEHPKLHCRSKLIPRGRINLAPCKAVKTSQTTQPAPLFVCPRRCTSTVETSLIQSLDEVVASQQRNGETPLTVKMAEKHVVVREKAPVPKDVRASSRRLRFVPPLLCAACCLTASSKRSIRLSFCNCSKLCVNFRPTFDCTLSSSHRFRCQWTGLAVACYYPQLIVNL